MYYESYKKKPAKKRRVRRSFGGWIAHFLLKLLSLALVILIVGAGILYALPVSLFCIEPEGYDLSLTDGLPSSRINVLLLGMDVLNDNSQRSDTIIIASIGYQTLKLTSVLREKEAEMAEKEIAIRERKLDAEVRKAADAKKYEAEREAEAELVRRQREADAQKYEAIQRAEAQKAEADAARYAMEQEAEGIRAKGIAEAEAIEKKAEAQKKMGEASIIEMYLAALPEVVKNAAMPLAQTDKIVMYGDGNSTKMVRDVVNSSNQILEGLKESTGIDLAGMLSGYVGGKMAASQESEG